MKLSKRPYFPVSVRPDFPLVLRSSEGPAENPGVQVHVSTQVPSASAPGAVYQADLADLAALPRPSSQGHL